VSLTLSLSLCSVAQLVACLKLLVLLALTLILILTLIILQPGDAAADVDVDSVPESIDSGEERLMDQIAKGSWSGCGSG